ncbi:MAG: cell division protein ZapB [Thermoanaerobaculia bacterium]
MAKEWLQELEQRVEGAIKEIERLRRENKSLKAQAERLGKQAAERQGGGGGAGGWEDERAAIRKRVERLVAGLERLAGPGELAE